MVKNELNWLSIYVQLCGSKLIFFVSIDDHS